jgi:hypothetical protein
MRINDDDDDDDRTGCGPMPLKAEAVDASSSIEGQYFIVFGLVGCG